MQRRDTHPMFELAVHATVVVFFLQGVRAQVLQHRRGRQRGRGIEIPTRTQLGKCCFIARTPFVSIGLRFSLRLLLRKLRHFLGTSW